MCGCGVHGFNFYFGLVPIALGFLLALRRFAFKRFLVLDSDTVSLPCGFLKLQTARIPYATIERVWQIAVLGIPVLSVATEEGTFELALTMFPNAASFVAVRDFLNSRAQEPVR